MKKSNLYNKEDKEEKEAELKLLSRKDYSEEHIYEIVSLIVYYINFLNLNQDNKSKNELIDISILNKLNPFLKKLIQEYK